MIPPRLRPTTADPTRRAVSGHIPRVESLEQRTLLSPLNGPGRSARGRAGQFGPIRNEARSAGAVLLSSQVYTRTDDGVALKLDVYLPRGQASAGGRPVIMAIHGGGWRRFDRQDYGRFASALTSAGYVVVAPDYTLSAPGVPSWPRNLDEVREAVRWTRRNAERLGIDPARIAAMGESAGGHLAALLGTADDVPGEDGVSSKVGAVVDFYGPADLASLVRDSPSAGYAVRQYLGGTPESLVDAYAQASPVVQASPDDAPTLIFHGTGDTLVPISQSRKLAQALESKGVRVRLVELPRAIHGFRTVVGRRNLVPELLAFLDSSWKDRIHLSFPRD